MKKSVYLYKNNYMNILNKKSFKILLIINSIVFSAQMLIPYTNYVVPLYPMGTDKFLGTQYLTSIFSHANLIHFAFNMLGLYFIIKMLEPAFTWKKVILYYLITGLASSVVYHLIGSPDKALVGASGALYGLLTILAFSLPNIRVYLFFIPIPIKLKNIFYAYIAIELFLFLTIQSADGVAHIVHLLGAFFGYVTFLLNKRGII